MAEQKSDKAEMRAMWDLKRWGIRAKALRTGCVPPVAERQGSYQERKPAIALATSSARSMSLVLCGMLFAEVLFCLTVSRAGRTRP